MIKKYQLFLEQITLSKTLSHDEAFLDFLNTIFECQKYYSDQNFDGMNPFSHSYTMCAKSHNDHNMDPERDLQLIKNYMRKYGWSEENVAELSKMPNFFNRIYRENTTASAPMDYYLYSITNNQFPLQGYKWEIDQNGEERYGDENELIIRFSYGWHRSKYGKLVIKQNIGSVSKFLMLCLKDISNVIIERLNGIFYLYQGFIGNENQNDLMLELKSCFFPDKDYKEIYIDSFELLKICKRISDINQSQLEFDNLIIGICNKLHLETRIISEGDIKITFIEN